MDRSIMSPPGSIMPERLMGMLERPDCGIYNEATGHGPAIVFAHGLGGNHLSWWQQVAHFAPHYTCVSFAHHGFAPSSPLPGGPDPADYADDLAALIAHLGLTDVRVMAQSMGGWCAVEYALRRPSELEAVVLAPTTGSIDPRQLPASWQPKLKQWEAASKLTQETIAARRIHPAAGLRMANEQPAMHLLYRHIDDMNAGLDKQALRRRLMAGRVRAPAELGTVACPILMLANDEDSVICPAAMEGIAAVVPGVRSARIVRAAHSAYFERPAVFNRIVVEFFASVG